MTRAEIAWCWFYGVVALVALVGTQWALVDFVSGPGSLGDALSATVEGPVATFVTIDLLAVAIAATAFMVVEGRRIGLPRLWVYVALVFLVAVSVAFPLFLLARTRRLASARDSL